MVKDKKWVSFNIEPGQTTWSEQPEDYKKAYHEYQLKKPYKIINYRRKPMSLDVLITGSSRPQLWPLFWESYKEMVHIRLPHKVSVHEDFVFPRQSEKVMEYLRALKSKGEIHNINYNKPPIGLGPSMTPYIMQKLKSKYMFYIQEDWMFERPIDIDHILWVMDNNPKINMIFFNKIKNEPVIAHMKQPEYTYSGMKMCLYHAWAFLPGIWRMDFVVKNWQTNATRPEGYFTNTAFGSHERRADVAYCENNMGVYMYGAQKEFRYVRHIGNDWRMAHWRLENGKPGGSHNSETMDKAYMAPWCIPYYIDGPTSKGDVSKRK